LDTSTFYPTLTVRDLRDIAIEIFMARAWGSNQYRPEEIQTAFPALRSMPVPVQQKLIDDAAWCYGKTSDSFAAITVPHSVTGDPIQKPCFRSCMFLSSEDGRQVVRFVTELREMLDSWYASPLQ
jgi:hypothetical protein